MEQLTVWCSLTGEWPEYRDLGESYVHILRDMVLRNLIVKGADGKPTSPRFVCLTDKEIPGIECIVEPDMPASWWNKMWLFKHATTGRNLYLDLDTAITGRLEPFVDALKGQRFTTLQDLAPNRQRPWVTTGVFYWEGDNSDIWTEWDKAGRPTDFGKDTPYHIGNHIGGDSAWFAHMRPTPSQYPWLQDVVGEKTIRSFKFDGVMWDDWPDTATTVVCLHGYPRPHQVTDGWLPKIWRIGGLGIAAWKDIVNTKSETIRSNMETNLKHPNAKILTGQVKPHDGTVCIAAGGPSLGDPQNLSMLEASQKCGAKIWALNGAYKFLRSKGITPDVLVIMDARAKNISFLDDLHGRTTYLMASSVDPSLIERLKDYNVWLWEPIIGDGEDQMNRTAIGGGSTVGLRSIMLAWVCGYRNFHLYGYDSSYRTIEGKPEGHAFAQPHNDGELETRVTINGKEFHCARWMARQCDELRDLIRALVTSEEYNCNFTVYGDGLFPYAIGLDSGGGDEPEQPAADSQPTEVAESSKEGL